MLGPCAFADHVTGSSHAARVAFSASSHASHSLITGRRKLGEKLDPVHVAAPEPIATGNLTLDPDDLLVRVGRTPLVLTVREFELLLVMVRNEGRLLSREQLYTAVWDQPFRADERSVDVYVAKLRRKLETAAPGWSYIHTHVGFGYRFDPQPPA